MVNNILYCALTSDVTFHCICCMQDRIATAAGETNWYSCSCPVGWTGANCGVEQATAMVQLNVHICNKNNFNAIFT